MDWRPRPPQTKVRAGPRRCAADNVTVVTHRNARRRDNFPPFFSFRPSSRVQSFGTGRKEKIYLQIIKTAGEQLQLASPVAEAVGRTWLLFFSRPFFLLFSFFFPPLFLRKAPRARPERSASAPCSHGSPFITAASVWRLDSPAALFFPRATCLNSFHTASNRL